MSFKVNLYTLSKRNNSTKRPSGSGREFDCILKRGCGILAPSISLDIGVTSDPSQYNYAYIPAFDRYYFIEEWFFEDALWTANMQVDVLATYKTEIGNSNLYILRSANDFDGRIVDTLYPTKTGCNFQTVQGSEIWYDDGMFVIGVANQYPSIASLCYYAMNIGQLRVFCSALMDVQMLTDNGFVATPEMSLQIQKAWVNPVQYIKSAIFIPRAISTGGSVSFDINGWSIGGSASTITMGSETETITRTFNIPKHPDTNTKGNYLNSSPFTCATLTIQPFGCFDLDTSVTCNASSVTATIDIDKLTGLGILTITCNGIVLNRIEAQVGVPIPLSQVTRDYVGAITSILGGVAGVAGGLATGNIAGSIGSGIGAIGDAVSSMQPRAQTIGSGGGYAQLWGKPRLDMQFFRAVDDDPAHNGRPLCQNRKISDLGGYMLIQDGDVPINGTSKEDEEIRNYLEGGFYYE